jgi:HEAT repeat protein
LGPKLRAIPPEVLRWAKTEDTSLVVRAAAIRVLGLSGRKEVAPVAREILDTFPYKYSNHMDVYAAATEALTDLGDPTVLPFVRKVLAELETGNELTSFDHPNVYSPALGAVERFPDKHPEFVPLLRKIIERNRGQGKSWYVASTLALLAPDEPLVYRAWAGAGVLAPQYQVLFAARIDRAKDIAVPHFRLLLSDPDPAVAFGAAAGLLRYGPADPEIVKVLGANLEDKRNPGRANPRLFESLPMIGPNCIPVLLGWLDHPSEYVRYEAARYLHRFGPTAAEYAPAIIARVGKEKTVYRKKDLLHAVRLMGPAAKGHAAALAPLLADPDMSVRYFAVRALAELDPRSPLLAKPCVDLYRACGKDPAKFGLPRLTWVGNARTDMLIDPHSKDGPHLAAARILYGVAPEEALAAGIADPAVGVADDFKHLYANP